MGLQKYEFYTLSPYIFVKKCRITKKMSTFAAYLSVKRKMKKVTILVPCFNDEASLPALYEALKELMDTHSSYAWEVLMVNDGSRDNTIDVIRQLRQRDERICYVDLSRNFGKENAMLAGFDYATGDCMVIMYADLQHPPHVIPEMLKYWEEGYEDVYAKRITRGKESWLRKRTTLLYYHLLQQTTRVEDTALYQGYVLLGGLQEA